MTNFTLLVATLVLCQTIVVFAKPQFNPDLRPTSTTPAPNQPDPTTTAASPTFLNCVANCQTTPQHNPVCGTDGVSYMSRAKLNCAQRCGQNVQILHVGTCGPSQGGK